MLGFNTDLIVTNSRFEDVLEAFHISEPGIIDFYNNEFIRPLNLDVGHVIHFYNFSLGSSDEQDFFRFKNNYVDASAGLWIENSPNSNITIEGNIFENALQGGVVYFGSGNTTIKNNTFNNCYAAINGNSAGNFNILKNNTFNNVVRPIIFSSGHTLFASGNQLNNTQVASEEFLFGKSGNYFFTNNIITDSQITGPNKSAFFIDSNGSGKVYAFGNLYNSTKKSKLFDISMVSKLTATSNVTNGGYIHLKGIDALNFYGNDVNGHNNKYAYRADMSNGKFCNNVGTNANYVFAFLGNCMNTEFTNNEIGQPYTLEHGTGLYVSDVIGQQEHKANLWNASFFNEGATNSSFDPLLSLITVNSDPNQGGNSLFIPQNNSYSPLNWFKTDYIATTFANCQTTNSPNPGNSDSHITYVDDKVIKGTYNTTPLSNWMAVRNVIRKLINHPSLLNDIEVNTWYQNQLPSASYAVAAIEYGLSDYHGTDTEVNDIKELLDDYIVLNDAISPLMPNDNAYAALAQDIDEVLQDLSEIQSTIDNRQVNIRSHVNTLLSGMATTNDYESLFKDIYTIQLEYLADNEYVMTSSEINVITEAASLCPLTYGTSIYVARTIANHYGISYDEENCNEIRKRSTSKEPANKYDISVYPNPATDKIRIKSSHAISEIKIYNTNMQLLRTSKETAIDVANMKSGIYICEAYSDNQLLGVQKFVVLK